MRAPRLAGVSILAAVTLSAACQPGVAGKQRPSEVPIGEFHADAPPASAEPGAASAPAPALPASSDDAGSLSGSEARGSDLATKLDDKNGFANASFGASPRSFRGLKQAKKDGDRVTYHLTAGTVHATTPLNNVDFTFTKNKLGVIAFTVKNSAQCKTFRAALERDFGAPQKVVPSPETAIWKGTKVALRYNGGATCGGTVMHRDHGAPDFASVDN
jgi:hypothetical protein